MVLMWSSNRQKPIKSNMDFVVPVQFHLNRDLQNMQKQMKQVHSGLKKKSPLISE